MSINRKLLCGVVLPFTINLTAAAAQTAPLSADRTAADQGLADIVVTAQRRKENIQRVPVAVTALTAEKLRTLNISQPQDLYGNVPSLVVGTQGQTTRDVQTYSIRGLATGFLSSPAVVVYVNEVPLPFTVSLSLQGGPGQFVDLEDAQVLAGPQGTLFGRNTTGGAILLTPHRPTNHFGGYVEGSVGNYDFAGIEGAVNIPIVNDKLSIRVSGAARGREGYTHDTVWNKRRDDTDWHSGRIGILFKPTPRFENYLLAYGAQSSTNGPGFVHGGFNFSGLQSRGACIDQPASPTSGTASCAIYRQTEAIAAAAGPRVTRPDIDEFARIKTWGVINTSEYELSDAIKLRNIVSYQKLQTSYASDQDGTPLQIQDNLYNAALPNFPVAGLSEYGIPRTQGNVYTNAVRNLDSPRESVKVFTEELQVQGSLLDRRLTFTVGGFLYDQRPQDVWQGTNLFGIPAAQTGVTPATYTFSGVSNKSHALYGQATLDLGAILPVLQGLRLTSGYRYTWDKISGFLSTYTPIGGTTNVSCPVNGAATGIVPASDAPSRCRYDALLNSHAPTWTAGIDYKAAGNVFLYGKVSRGYKSGGFNTVAVRPEAYTYQPEKVITYEVGAKTDWRVGRMPVRLNLTYYYSNYENIQKPAGDFNPVTGRSGAQILAAAAHIRGFEGEVSIRPFRMLDLTGTVSHTDPKYTSFTQVTPFGALACNGVVPAGGTADYSCLPFAYVNKWIYSLSGVLTLPTPKHLGKVVLTMNYSHVGSQPTSPTTLPSIEPGSVLKPYGLLKASFDWHNVGSSPVDIGVFATNITNKLYRVSNSNVFGSSLHWASLYGEPRMYGLRIRYTFGKM